MLTNKLLPIWVLEEFILSNVFTCTTHKEPVDTFALCRIRLRWLNLQCSAVYHNLMVERSSVKDINNVLQNVNIFNLIALFDNIDDKLFIDKLVIERLVV